jgi:ubiquitin carboxyl-terminal hydrolase 7
LGKPSDILRKLNEMAGFTPEEEIELYEARVKLMI